jgi:hypothetical protein
VGRALALAAVIRELVITTGPLVGKLLLRERGDSPLFHQVAQCGGYNWSADGVILWAQFDCGESVTVSAEGCGKRV